MLLRAILRAELPDLAETSLVSQSYIDLRIPLTEFFCNLSVQFLWGGTARFYPPRYGETLPAVGPGGPSFSHTK